MIHLLRSYFRTLSAIHQVRHRWRKWSKYFRDKIFLDFVWCFHVLSFLLFFVHFLVTFSVLVQTPTGSRIPCVQKSLKTTRYWIYSDIWGLRLVICDLTCGLINSSVKSHELQVISLKSWVTSHESQVMSHKSWVTSHESQVTSHKSWVTSHESQGTSHESQVMGHKSWVTSHKAQVMSHKSWVTSWVRSHKSWVTSHELQVMSHKSWVTSHELQGTSYKSWVTSHGSQGTSYKSCITSHKSIETQVTSHELQLSCDFTLWLYLFLGVNWHCSNLRQSQERKFW